MNRLNVLKITEFSDMSITYIPLKNKDLAGIKPASQVWSAGYSYLTSGLDIEFVYGLMHLPISQLERFHMLCSEKPCLLSFPGKDKSDL